MTVRDEAVSSATPRHALARIVRLETAASIDASVALSDRRATRAWNSASKGIRSACEAACSTDTTSRSSSARVASSIRSAAIRVAAGSRIRRTAISSSEKPSCISSTAALTPSSSSSGRRLVT